MLAAMRNYVGGYGSSGSLSFFTENLRLPMLVVLLVFAAEFLRPIGLAA